MNLLNVRDLSMTYGVEMLFDGVGFGLDDGERVAVVGPNGCGKSTLFKILAGDMLPDRGDIAYRGGTTIGYLRQKADFDSEITPREIVARALTPVREAIAEHVDVSTRLESPAPGELDELLARQAELQERIRLLGGWDWKHQVEEMFERLGISALIDRRMGLLSGGQQRRVDLARVLLESPDLLLLDEPTNHLDTGAVEWLEGWLRGRTKTLLLVTHDRYFLENVVDRILEIDDDGFYDYPGNYETFMERKLHRMEVRKRTEQRRSQLMKKELEWLRDGTKARTTRSKKRLKQLKQLVAEGPAYEEQRMQMELAEASRLGDVILEARGVDKSFGNLTLLQRANISLRPGDKLGIIGPNGCGKSTLLRMLMGKEPIDAGTIEAGKRTDIGYLRQGEFDVAPGTTVYEAMGESDYVWVGDQRYHKRDYLDQFLFDHNLQKVQVEVLSGGQRRRLALARLVARNANVLILDEPTNDLDILSLQAMESALDAFDGCIIAVSHDRYFLNRVCESIVAFEDRKLVRYDGDYDSYRRTIDDDDEGSSVSANRPAPAPSGSPAPKETKKLTYAERLRVDALEAEIAGAEDAKAKIEDELADPTLYQSRPDDIAPLNESLREAEARLEELMAEWMALEARRG